MTAFRSPAGAVRKRVEGKAPSALAWAHEMEAQPVMTSAHAEATDEALLARIAGGDSQAFAIFYDRHASLLYSLALRIVGDGHDAEDVLQDAAVQLWERAPRYNPMFGRPLSWAVTLLRNKAVDRLRASNRKRALHEAAATGIGPDADEPASGADETAAGEDSERVRAAIRRLPADQRTAIEMAFFGGMTQLEISNRLGAPLGTIKARIRRGMLAMRDELAVGP
jgi:RNA polymerase sigma-70 factor, ECF subfamily